MNFARPIDFAALMEPVALKLLGEPNTRLSTPPRDVRFGTRGSLAVDTEEGKWFDHEKQIGGGVLDLISHKTGRNRGEALAWLKRERIYSSETRPSAAQPCKPATASRAGHIVATYDYVDENGELIFQVVRFDPKDFRQRRPARADDDTGKVRGGWVWNLDGVLPVPYQLPELITAVATGKTIYIPEGEKDADSLRTLGFAATTNPGGAKKWKQDFAKYLQGADVVVLPDNHLDGREHGEMVAASLHGIAKRVRVLDIGAIWPACPAKGDVTDWLTLGEGDAGAFRQLVEALPEWKPARAEDTAAQPKSPESPDTNPTSCAMAWPKIDDAAFNGIAGDIVRTIEPHTEADPVALLVQILTVAGNVVGRLPYYQVKSDQHRANIFAVLVGDSSKGRKGTSLGRIRSIVKTADEKWCGDRIKTGLSSGEGFINEVRDPVEKYDPKRKSI